VRFTATLKRARKAKASRRRGSRKESIADNGESGVVKWSPRVSLFPYLAQILSTPRPEMVKFESTGSTSTHSDCLDPDVRNVLSSLWSTRPEDSPWVTSEAMDNMSRTSSVIKGEITPVGRPRNYRHVSRMSTSEYSRAQDDGDDVMRMYEDMSSCLSDSRSSGFGSSAASSRSASSSESMW
jgi:hypothetical protein